MYSINDKQIDYILDDIRRRGVEMEDLQYNLLDHICCIIEQNLESDGNFEDFYQNTIPKFFKHELWEIEEETILLLTYKNYYTMKKAMILGGNISLALIALGTVFKIFHWAGATPLLLLGFFILCFVFFPAALYLNYNSSKKALGSNLTAFLGGTILMIGVLFKVMHWPGTPLLLILGSSILLLIFVPLLLFSSLKESASPKEKRIYVLGALGIIPFGYAVLFKIMHWPGAGPLLNFGSFILVVLFIPMYTNMKIKSNAMSPGQFAFVITLSMYVVILVSLLALNVSKHVLERFERDEVSDASIIKYFEKKRERLLNNATNDSTAIALTETKKMVSENAAQVKELIHSIRIDLVSSVEEVDKTKAQDLLLHPAYITRMDNYDRVNQFFLTDPNTQYAAKLKTAIEAYRVSILKVAGDNAQFVSKINGLLNTSDKVTPEYTVPWAQETFQHNPLISTLALLSRIEKNICLLEIEILTFKN